MQSNLNQSIPRSFSFEAEGKDHQPKRGVKRLNPDHLIDETMQSSAVRTYLHDTRADGGLLEHDRVRSKRQHNQSGGQENLRIFTKLDSNAFLELSERVQNRVCNAIGFHTL